MDLSDARYFNLATFRKTGAAVETPVWFAGVAPTYYVFSEGRAGKVKRIRANGRARVAACDVRGRILGPWHDARARIIEDSGEVATAYRALRARYGWQMWITDCLSKLSGRYDKRALIAVEVSGG